MKIIETKLSGVHVINYNSFKDNRGEFVKTIHEGEFAEFGLDWKFTESFYSLSHKNVIRGMHFQYPPHDHGKLVYVIAGKIIDVVLDLRKSSETFGQFFSVEVSAGARNAIYIGKGFAHGFLGLDEQNIVEYHTTTVQSKECEGGVKYDSFGFNWNVKSPVISDRDDAFENFDINKQYFV